MYGPAIIWGVRLGSLLPVRVPRLSSFCVPLHPFRLTRGRIWRQAWQVRAIFGGLRPNLTISRDSSILALDSGAGVAELADARDSNSRGLGPCGFDSHLRHCKSTRTVQYTTGAFHNNATVTEACLCREPALECIWRGLGTPHTQSDWNKPDHISDRWRCAN